MATTGAKKRTWPRIRQVTHKNGTPAWQVDARREGRGERFFYPTRREAETKADLLRIVKQKGGTDSLDIPDALRVEATKCAATLAPFNVSITEAVAYYVKHAKPEGGTKTVAALVEEFMQAKKAKGLKKSYLDVQGYVLRNVFAKSYGDRLVHEVNSAELEVWLNRKEWTLRTRLNYYRDLHNLFGFAMRKNYCAANPLERIEKPKPPAKAPGFLTVDDARALLVAPETVRMGMQASVAIGLFCGLRTSEIEQLDWSHVRLDLGTIAVSAESAKMNERRIVDISDNLRAWIEPLAKTSGLVAPEKTFDWRLSECWKSTKIAKKKPKNALRHSYCTYHLAHHRNIALTIDQVGHFGSARTLVGSYRNVVGPAEAAAFWAIRPNGD